MQDNLGCFLQDMQPLCTESAIWVDGEIHLQITGYVTEKQVPLEYVSSVRAVLIQDKHVMVVEDQSGYHILPGGRCDQGEELIDTLRRELLEETGWSVTDIAPLGFLHFQHKTPKPEGYVYPYPDFLQVVYTARAEQYYPDKMFTEEVLRNEYVLAAMFRPVEEVVQLSLSARNRLFLEAAQRHWW